MQLHGLAVDPDVRDAASGGDDGLTRVERRRRSDGFDREIHPRASGEGQHLRDRVFGSAVDDERRATPLRHMQAVVVEIDHQNRTG